MIKGLRFKIKVKRRVLIHIGTEKTGTSSLQEFLHLNRDLLAKHGVGYLKSPGLRNNRNIATYCMAFDRIDDHIVELGLTSKKSRDLWRKNFKSEFENEINALSSEINDVIISSEHFHSRLCSENEISNLQELLKPFFSEIKIIVYLRRQDKIATSFYSTACRVGLPLKRVVPREMSENDHYYNYFNLLEKWSSAFGVGNIIPRIFEKEKLLRGNLISDFIFYSGIIKEDWKIIRPANQNESLSEIVQDVIISFNKHFPIYTNNKPCAVSKKLRDNLIKKLECAFQGKSKMPCREDALNFYNVFTESNKKLAGKWFETSILFSEDFSSYPEKVPPLKKEYEIFDYLFSVFSEFLSNYFLAPKELLKNIDLSEDNGAVFRDVALLFEHTQPEIAYFLMKEALKNRPYGPFIKKKIQEFELRIG